MSFEAMKWASGQQAGSSTNKLLLLLLANYADQDFSCFPSIRKLAEMAECCESTVRRSLKDLRGLGLIEVRERYEAYGDKNRQTSNTYILKGGCQIDTPPPVKSTTPPLSNIAGHITNQNNQSEYTSTFLEFWKAYPRRPNSSKKDAFKKYKIALQKIPQAKLLEATTNFAKTQINTDPQYIPHASTWLNQERYMDVLEQPKLKTNRNRIAG